jgi:transposase
MGMSFEPAAPPDNPVVLKAMIAALQADNARMSATLRAHDQLIQTLRLRIATLKKQVFGKSSEKIEREIEQLELALEDLLVARAESAVEPMEGDAAEPPAPPAPDETPERKPRRRPRVSDATPRERREIDPGACCPDCGGELRLVGEDVSEILDMVAAHLKVLQVARLKKSCRCCEKMVQEPAPSRPIPGSMAGASLLAYILVSKFDDHLPLYRLNEIFARMGADIPDTTLVDWCGRAMKVLQPLIDRIDAEIMASDLLHADDTPIRVLDRSQRDKGLGKGVKKGRIWTYVRDQRPWAGQAPPGAVYRFAPDWKEEHVREHLGQARGMPHRPMATRATPSSLRPRPTASHPSARRPVGRIGAATFTTSGPGRNPRSRGRRWTASARSTTSSAPSPASPPRSGWPHARSTASRRSRPSAPGPSSN